MCGKILKCFIKRVKIEPHFLLSPMITRAGAVLALQGYQAISDLSTPMIAPASSLVLFNKNIANFTHKRWENQYSKSFGFCDRTFS